VASSFLCRTGRVDRTVEVIVAVDAVHRCVDAGTSLSALVSRASVVLRGVIFLSAYSANGFLFAHSGWVTQLVAVATLRDRTVGVVGGKSAGGVAYCKGASFQGFQGVLADECNHGGGERFVSFFSLFLCCQPTRGLT
jgi:hypothetical protein